MSERASGRPRREEHDAPPARLRESRWHALVWVLPLAALAFAAWLVLRSDVLTTETVVVRFEEAGGIAEGTPVRFKGVDIGTVESVSLSDDLSAVELTLSISEPTAGHLGAESLFWIGGFSLGGVLGATYVALEPGGGDATRRFEGLAHAPEESDAAAPELTQAISSVARFARKLDDVPVTEIAESLRSASERIEALVASPELARSLSQLDDATARLEQLIATIDGDIEPILGDLRGASRAAESTASALDELTGGTLRHSHDLPRMVEEVTRAARSLRELADHLVRQPESLLVGRDEE